MTDNKIERITKKIELFKKDRADIYTWDVDKETKKFYLNNIDDTILEYKLKLLELQEIRVNVK